MGGVPKLSKELDNAIEDDRKYKEVDCAKKRAVAQRVDYDTFKNMVSVAHLKPLQAPDEVVRVRGAPAWRFNSIGQDEGNEVNERTIQNYGNVPTEQPSTSAEFERVWRRCCKTNSERYAFIKFCSLDTLAKIFKVELSSSLLVSILEVLCDRVTSEVKHEDAEQVCNILRCLSKSGRFSLTIQLMGRKHKQIVRDIVQHIEGPLADKVEGIESVIHEIFLAYGACEVK